MEDLLLVYDNMHYSFVLNIKKGKLYISYLKEDEFFEEEFTTISPEQMESITRILFNEVFEEQVVDQWDDKEQKYVQVHKTIFKTLNPNYDKFSWTNNNKDTTKCTCNIF